ncbi:ParA family protein [Archaeoglobus fulgidus]|uniref:Cell division inhibitor (MinD-2) n=2 Tax=Archaeoglobus fulgidus TaxID=2234 RepID=O28342_ARCFU|nr:MinD/ParA family protein [Archaeoglobus fulgidus]AAB89318.1 cell division inhibitor (minD-2) [Archaeoglobus fulgidus DSM 4304]AIG98931.1 ATPase involved in chromosome partitioning [Archaeoglobus fulgidus DSM 8774]
MREVLAAVSGKESEGKSTLTVNLSVLMAQKDYRVAVIDFDPSLPALSSLCKVDDVPLTAKNVIDGFASVDDIFYSGISGVEVIPAGMSIKEFRKANLRDLLERVEESADVLFLDVPGGLCHDSVLAIYAATSVLLVIKPEAASLEAALPLPRIIEKLKADFAGVVLNKVEEGEVEIDDVEALIGNVIAEIPYDEAIKKAMASGRPVIFSSPMSESSKSFVEISEALSVWIDSFEGERRELVAGKRLFKALCP